MKAVCTSNDPMLLADHQRSRASNFESAYPLTVGKTYLVLGMSIFENVFDFLVQDDWGGPCFAPAGFFELFSAPLPAGWYFSLRAGVRTSGRGLWSQPGVAVWGYLELVEDLDHASKLQEREDAALNIFERYVALTEAIG